MAEARLARSDITGIVLAGGLGRRMSADGKGVDKGLQPFRGRPMVAHVIDRLAAQVGAIVVNANRNAGRYREFGWPVVADAIEGFAGPLAGLHAGLAHARTPWVVTAPCDSPFLPLDLVQRLASAIDESAARGERAQLAVARTGTQPHPVFALVDRSLLPDLQAFLESGRRKIDAWYAPLRVVEVAFEDGAVFRNINTVQELKDEETPMGEAPSRPAAAGAARTIAELASCLSDYDPNALPVARAKEIIAASVEPVAVVERVPIRSALNRVLAVDLVSPIDVPSYDNSAMDGYALRAADLAQDGETRLRIAGTALAGSAFTQPVGNGEALRVMTGAILPCGLDTVVAQETVRIDAGFVVVPPGQQRGQNRRLRGEDLRAGDPALRVGKRLAPADIGLLASLGIPEVPVRRRLRVAFFSTGNELRSLGETLEPGQLYDSNRYTIWAMLARLDVDIVDMGVVRDSPQALEEAMRTAAADADAIVSSGGVSVGEADFTRQVMQRLGDVAFWRIAMRPGRPMAFGRVGRACYFGLPGNPVAVMVTFHFLVRDALLRMMGAEPRALPWVRARSAREMRKRPGRTEYQRGVLAQAADGRMEVELLGNQGSGVLRSMSEANCVVVLHHDQGQVSPGDEVDCIAFEGLL